MFVWFHCFAFHLQNYNIITKCNVELNNGWSMHTPHWESNEPSKYANIHRLLIHSQRANNWDEWLKWHNDTRSCEAVQWQSEPTTSAQKMESRLCVLCLCNHSIFPNRIRNGIIYKREMRIMKHILYMRKDRKKPSLYTP